ncbi:pleckstrin homology domain-containing family A member 8 isoform X2 [Hemiscyllium ocellatum]|uniref:pleckstrin homology domain-containing family A member 8 isoform X2 n=1 Tax=Hemiscyllium ocellatum TaxID=170820 RepID=UPI0029677B15|nr:pleckstrin homology domain-containing family A member 8 isoform X2 [Hemiscyllium ocellatum]
MEGMLYKWTNYLSGWQPRWFILAGGILSYYDSQEDTWKGCKGSIKMAVCEIQVHNSDNTRMELIIPGEQHFYLKAANAADRQRWLVALGSSKACLTDSRTKKEKEISENTESLKKKVSELRLYCDLLLHQVNNLKASAQSNQSNPTDTEIDMATLLRSTCNTFMKTLDECMQIANATLRPELFQPTPPSSPHVTVIKPNRIKHHHQSSYSCTKSRNELNNFQNESTIDEANFKTVGRPQSENDNQHQLNSRMENAENMEERMDNTEVVVAASEKTDVNVELQPSEFADEVPTSGEDLGDTNATPETEDREIQTFFSAMEQRFNDIEFEEENGIPTLPFLESCYAIVPVLDKLGPTVFAPVKLDFVGNIKKINQKYITDSIRFTTLQKIVLYELETDEATVRNSATEALLWLKRGLKFLKGFLEEVNNGEKDIQKALNTSYSRTLRQYHGWVVRGVFALALRAAPFYEGFMAALAVNEGDELNEAFYEGMKRDLSQYLPAMGKQIEILDALYEEYNLESDEVV